MRRIIGAASQPHGHHLVDRGLGVGMILLSSMSSSSVAFSRGDGATSCPLRFFHIRRPCSIHQQEQRCLSSLSSEQRRHAAESVELSESRKKLLRVSPEYNFLKKIEPLTADALDGGLPLIAWEFLFEISALLKTDDEALSAGKPSVLSVNWRKRYSREADIAEGLQAKLIQLQEAATLAEEESDEEMKAMAKEEVNALAAEVLGSKEELQECLEKLLVRLDIVGSTSEEWVLETVGRAGGEEAVLFAGELFNTYKMLCEHRGWRFSDMTDNSDEEEGRKNRCKIRGEDVYRTMRYEIGTHRVQRVPVTEASGRMQTSTASVLLLPLPDLKSVDIRREDCEIEMIRGSGPGGQGVNSSSNCARVFHKPSGIRKRCHHSRSGNENVDIALRMIAQEVWAQQFQESRMEVDSVFASQFGSGERATKLRTYNEQQNRVTDQRLRKDYRYTSFLGEPDEITDSQEQLAKAHHATVLEGTLRELIDKKIPAEG